VIALPCETLRNLVTLRAARVSVAINYQRAPASLRNEVPLPSLHPRGNAEIESMERARDTDDISHRFIVSRKDEMNDENRDRFALRNRDLESLA